MDIIFGQLALTIAAAFTGAAIYVIAVEQPARLKLDDKPLLKEWKPAYKRGTAMQAPLALIGSLCGLVAWFLSDEMGFLLGAILLVANWPWTLLVMIPTNNRLMSIEPVDPNPEARALIRKWLSLHTVRTVLGALATIAFFVRCILR